MSVGSDRRRKGAMGRRLGLEPLESREMLSGNPVVVPIVSGSTYVFRDADGTTVKVKLTGPGAGQMTLTNGLATGGSIDTLTVTGTTSTSQLKITAAGGSDGQSTIDNLVVGQAPGAGTVLNKFSSSGLNVSAGGELQFYGGVNSLIIDDVGAGASVNVAGSLGSLIADAFAAGASLDVSGTISSINVTSLGAGSEIVAPQLTKLTVSGLASGAVVNIGDGGIQSAFFQSVVNSNVYTAGNVGAVVINASSAGSAIAANRDPGSDGVFGTLDDFTMDAAAAGTIGTVTLNGAVGTGASALQLIATGSVETVTVPTGQPKPEIVDEAISQFIPLEIAQAVAAATSFEDDEIWIAVFGQEIVTPKAGQVPPTGVTYYLDASSLNAAGASGQPTPIPISTATLHAGINTPNQPILPSSTIAAWANASSAWNSNLQLPVPQSGHQFTGRIIISVGAPIQAQVFPGDGTVDSPSASNVTDPSTGTFYDFLEFTVTNAAGVVSLDVDTSQVDAFGLPMTLQFFQDVAAQNPFNVEFTATTVTGNKVVTVTSDMRRLQAGQVVTGAGIPVGTLIDSVDKSGGTITLSNAPSANGTGVTLSALNGGPVGVDGTRHEILDGSDANSLLKFVEAQLASGYEAARPFLQTAKPFEVAGAVPITGATSSGALIVYTNSTNGLQTGDVVSISGVQGATAANGVFTISNITANSFQLNGVTASQTYVSGGAWSLAITGASNPGPGQEIVITASNTGALQNGDLVQISGVAGNANANGFFFVSNVTATTFTLVGSNGNSATPYASGGTWRVYQSGPRIVSPKDIVETLPNAQSTNELNNYFNEAIDAFFLQYLPANQTVQRGGNTYHGGGETFSIQSSASGSTLTYTGTVKNVGALGYVLFLSTPTSATPFVIFYPFTNDNLPSDYTPLFPTVDAPSWLVASGKQGQSASRMIFACDAFFADNTLRAAYYNLPNTWSAVLGDLEDSISAAFNRGIALNDPSTWGDRTTWFQQNNDQAGKYNYWVQYWHQSGLAVNDLAYAFPYDDKYGSSTNLNVPSVGLARILLNSWSAVQQSTTTAFVDFPASAQQQGTVTLTANVARDVAGPTPTGTVTFFIDGVAINSNDFSGAPPWQPVAVDGSGAATITATLPALADGSTTQTYTVTAIYSGDATSAPSIAYQSLKLVGVNGDFLMTLAPAQAAMGTSVNVTATLPGSVFDGTVAFTVSLSDGSRSQALGAPVAISSSALNANITIPSNLLAFTGDTAVGSNVISNVSNTVNLLEGQMITNANFTGPQQITGITPPGLTLSQAAVKTGTVSFTANGVTFTGTVTEGQTTLTGLNTLAGLVDGVAITQVSGSSPLLAPGTTIDALVQGSVQVLGTASHAVNGTTFVSNGAGAVFPVTATFTPTSGGPYVAFVGFQGPALP
jgi:hypothetical protein